MSVIVRRKKIIKECDGGAVGGAVQGMPSAPMNTLYNTGGMGNPVPPSEHSAGSGDNFGNIISGVSTQVGPKKYKLRRKK